MKKTVKHTIGNKTYSKTLEVSVKYSCSTSSYLKIGSVYSTTLEANTLEELQEKKDAFILVEGDRAEVITFGKFVVTTVETVDDSNEVKYFVDETTNKYLMTLARSSKKSYDKKKKYFKCHDKFDLEIKNGSFVDVQQDGIQKVYAKDGQLHFKPYGEECMVADYFSNDLILVDETGDPIIDQT
jgi:hypothetical protein